LNRFQFPQLFPESFRSVL